MDVERNEARGPVMTESEIHGNGMATPPKAIIRDAGDGYGIWSMGGHWTIKANAEDTGGELAAMEILMPGGTAPPLHAHHHEVELMYVVEGEVSFRCGEEQRACQPGAFVYLPRGVPHAFKVESSQARLLGLVVPGGLERFYEAVGEPATKLKLPDAPPDVARWLELSHGYGIEVVGPPLS
jgi:quercetin dioxygenase-like cupin family protein